MTSTACQKKLRATFAYYILTSMCLPSLSQAESFDRRTLYLADSGRIGDQFVRYTAATGSPCISMSSTLEIIHKYHIISAQISAWEKPF
ncbi:hypothetical protein [Pseudomonas putida]|uniref:hypothetical protein n=1 Tax=Pseudomonas putida TaxID=303 RepID=UPI001198224E|nr:hypothetical protein [Pseudomonas putida]